MQKCNPDNQYCRDRAFQPLRLSSAWNPAKGLPKHPVLLLENLRYFLWLKLAGLKLLYTDVSCYADLTQYASACLVGAPVAWHVSCYGQLSNKDGRRNGRFLCI